MFWSVKIGYRLPTICIFAIKRIIYKSRTYSVLICFVIESYYSIYLWPAIAGTKTTYLCLLKYSKYFVYGIWNILYLGQMHWILNNIYIKNRIFAIFSINHKAPQAVHVLYIFSYNLSMSYMEIVLIAQSWIRINTITALYPNKSNALLTYSLSLDVQKSFTNLQSMMGVEFEQHTSVGDNKCKSHINQRANRRREETK